jgi:hypothetical protein
MHRRNFLILLSQVGYELSVEALSNASWKSNSNDRKEQDRMKMFFTLAGACLGATSMEGMIEKVGGQPTVLSVVCK